MADRRMFSKEIIDSDAFLDMPLSTQALYFHLSMRADDDGFINNYKKIQRVVGCSDDDFKLLVAKRFLIIFESGVIVIKHWRMHNYIRADRYKPTAYQDEKSMLQVKENGSYTIGIPNGNQMATQVRLGKDRIDKEREADKPPSRSFIPPTLEEVKAYIAEKKLSIDAKAFIDYYEATEWKDSKGQRVKSWKGKAQTWNGHVNTRAAPKKNPAIDFQQRDYPPEHFEKDRQESINMLDDYMPGGKYDPDLKESDKLLEGYYE